MLWHILACHCFMKLNGRGILWLPFSWWAFGLFLLFGSFPYVCEHLLCVCRSGLTFCGVARPSHKFRVGSSIGRFWLLYIRNQCLPPVTLSHPGEGKLSFTLVLTNPLLRINVTVGMCRLNSLTLYMLISSGLGAVIGLIMYLFK